MVFALNFPRSRKLDVPKALFAHHFRSFPGNFKLIYTIPAASLLIFPDTVVWLATVLATSGPLLLSGVYEALLDMRILRYLDSRIKKNSLSVQQRAYLLLIVLLGNLDPDQAFERSRQIVANLPINNLRARLSFDSRAAAGPPVALEDIAKTHEESSSNGTDCGREIEAVKIKLKCILHPQNIFGSSVGAPILFNISSFLYSNTEVRSKYGDGYAETDNFFLSTADMSDQFQRSPAGIRHGLDD